MASYEIKDGKKVLVHKTKIPGKFDKDLPKDSPPKLAAKTNNNKPA